MKLTASIRDADLPQRIRNRWAARRPRGALDVTRAVVRDGDHIWVTADFPSAGGFAAIDTATGSRTSFTTRVDVGLGTAWLPVAELPGEDERSFRLVFRGDGADRPLYDGRTAPKPTIPPVASGGGFRYPVRPGRGGLEVRRVVVPEMVPIGSLGLADGQLELTWDAREGVDLRAVSGDGGELRVAVAVDGKAIARFPDGLDLPVGPPQALVLVNEFGTTPLGRPGNDLGRPNAAVLLPEVSVGTDHWRFLWSDAGLLLIQRRRPQ